MQLSFKFNDFFRENNGHVTDCPDVKTPTFLFQSGVFGDLEVLDLQGSLVNDENDRLEVNLEGMMKTELDTCIDSRAEFRVTVEKKALSVRRHASGTTTNGRQYPFKFDLESWLRHDQESCVRHRVLASRSNFSSIPPSLRHEVLSTPQGVPKPRAGAQVTYRLTARLLREHKTIGRAIQPILLLISQAPSPPLCLTDFKDEYRTSQKNVLRGPLFQKAGEISVHVIEPKPLCIKADSIETMVEVPIRLRLERPRHDPLGGHTPCIGAEVKWSLRFSTFVSMLEQSGPVTVKQATRSPATAYVRSSLKPRDLRMTWRSWSLKRSTNTSMTLESKQSLWLTLPRSEILTPTFWSSFLSRRYSIALHVKITKPGSAKLEVEVPIQVNIETATSTSANRGTGTGRALNGNTVFEDAEGDELLPSYAR